MVKMTKDGAVKLVTDESIKAHLLSVGWAEVEEARADAPRRGRPPSVQTEE